MCVCVCVCARARVIPSSPAYCLALPYTRVRLCAQHSYRPKWRRQRWLEQKQSVLRPCQLLYGNDSRHSHRRTWCWSSTVRCSLAPWMVCVVQGQCAMAAVFTVACMCERGCLRRHKMCTGCVCLRATLPVCMPVCMLIVCIRKDDCESASSAPQPFSFGF